MNSMHTPNSRDESAAATNYRTKSEPDGSKTEWESYDGGKSWGMVKQTYPRRSPNHALADRSAAPRYCERLEAGDCDDTDRCRAEGCRWIEQPSAAPTYPATPVDCLLSDLTAIAEQSYDEAMWEDFVERLRQWRLEKEQFLGE